MDKHIPILPFISPTVRGMSVTGTGCSLPRMDRGSGSLSSFNSPIAESVIVGSGRLCHGPAGQNRRAHVLRLLSFCRATSVFKPDGKMAGNVGRRPSDAPLFSVFLWASNTAHSTLRLTSSALMFPDLRLFTPVTLTTPSGLMNTASTAPTRFASSREPAAR